MSATYQGSAVGAFWSWPGPWRIARQQQADKTGDRQEGGRGYKISAERREGSFPSGAFQLQRTTIDLCLKAIISYGTVQYCIILPITPQDKLQATRQGKTRQDKTRQGTLTLNIASSSIHPYIHTHIHTYIHTYIPTHQVFHPHSATVNPSKSPHTLTKAKRALGSGQGRVPNWCQ